MRRNKIGKQFGSCPKVEVKWIVHSLTPSVMESPVVGLAANRSLVVRPVSVIKYRVLARKVSGVRVEPRVYVLWFYGNNVTVMAGSELSSGAARCLLSMRKARASLPSNHTGRFPQPVHVCPVAGSM